MLYKRYMNFLQISNGFKYILLVKPTPSWMVTTYGKTEEASWVECYVPTRFEPG